MSGAVAFVFGLCALSFAGGCVLTAVMLRREPEPVPEPEPVVEAAEQSAAQVRWPPEDYGAKPIHRNPVLGLPEVPPATRPARPALALVPHPEGPSKQDRVRRMRLVREAPAVAEPVPPDPACTGPAVDGAPSRSGSADGGPVRRESNP